jgi:hypothetical protein
MSKQELDEEKDEVEVEKPEGEPEVEEAEEKPEGEETEIEADSESQDADTSKKKVPSEDEDELFSLADGSRVTYEELVAGYMKDADYRRKTAELAAQKRQEVQTEPVKTEPKEADDPFLSKFDKQQVEDFKLLAKKLGFVAKDDLEVIEHQKSKQETINAFFATHKEYAKEHDPTDARYNSLLSELELYNLNGAKDAKVVQKILEKAHEAVEAKFSSAKDKAKLMAQKVRIKAAAIGSGGSGGAAKEDGEDTNYTPEQIAVMKRMGVYEE